MAESLEDKFPPGARTVELKAGKKYSFCSCGHSNNLPFCDNTHRKINEERGTNYKSFKVCVCNDTKILIYSSNWLKISE